MGKDIAWWLFVVFFFFILTSTWMAASYFYERYEISGSSLKYRNAWGVSGQIELHDIIDARHSFVGYVVLLTREGRRIRISEYLRGFTAFARVLIRHLSGAGFDAAALKILRKKLDLE